MSLLAIEWSDGYKKGIEWKVVDSFFLTPELYIKTKGSQENWEKLSVNNSFSWGNKIESRKKV